MSVLVPVQFPTYLVSGLIGISAWRNGTPTSDSLVVVVVVFWLLLLFSGYQGRSGL